MSFPFPEQAAWQAGSLAPSNVTLSPYGYATFDIYGKLGMSPVNLRSYTSNNDAPSGAKEWVIAGLALETQDAHLHSLHCFPDPLPCS